MSPYKNKSDIFGLAAEKMHNQSLYPTVPPLAYYSCFLLMQHICYVEKQHSENSLRALPESAMMHGIHEIMINYFRNEFRKRNNLEDCHAFYNKICELRRLRIEADYKNRDIMSSQSYKAIALSAEVIHILNKL
jgi:hypothetical protein